MSTQTGAPFTNNDLFLKNVPEAAFKSEGTYVMSLNVDCLCIEYYHTFNPCYLPNNINAPEKSTAV